MKIVLFIATALLTFGAVAQKKIHWMTIEEAVEAQKKEPKKIMIDVYTDWCGPCKMMMSRTFTDEKTIDYINKNYYAVKFNAEGNSTVSFKGKDYTNPNYDPNKAGRNGTHEFTMAIAPVNGRVAYPTLVYLDEEANMLTPVQGYLTPDRLMPIISFFGENAYKTMSYEDFVAKEFKPAAE